MKWFIVPKSYWHPASWDDADVNCPAKVRRFMERSYDIHGGLLQSFESLIEECDVFHLLNWRDPTAAIFGKSTAFGTKWIALGVTSSPPKQLLEKILELCRIEGNYSEMSGPLASFMMRHGCPVVGDITVIQRVLNKHIWSMAPPAYVRRIHGKDVTKILLGRPRL